jgi:hypothetical protein
MYFALQFLGMGVASPYRPLFLPSRSAAGFCRAHLLRAHWHQWATTHIGVTRYRRSGVLLTPTM